MTIRILFFKERVPYVFVLIGHSSGFHERDPLCFVERRQILPDPELLQKLPGRPLLGVDLGQRVLELLQPFVENGGHRAGIDRSAVAFGFIQQPANGFEG